MSANKYANLPDIDTAPDVYETEDTFPSANGTKGDSSDEEGPSRPALRARSGGAGGGAGADGDEIDGASFDAEEASRKFRRAERKREHKPRLQYAYPPSPTEGDGDGEGGTAKRAPLAQRLRLLQAELAALEAEAADPSNPQLAAEAVDPGELIRGLVDVRGRLERIRGRKEGRGKLVSVVVEDAGRGGNGVGTGMGEGENGVGKEKSKGREGKGREVPEVRTIAEMDRRVGELEELVGSTRTALDESSPLPPPLLPLLTRLNAQLALLTQPRHMDAISRRLKLLLSDLERVSASTHHHRRTTSNSASAAHPNGSNPNTNGTTSANGQELAEQLAPVLARLGPALPHIPHVLARLRTLGALHAGAAAFAGTLDALEGEQRRTREALAELARAVQTVEGSLEENRAVVGANVRGLEERVEGVLRRLEEVAGSG